MYWDLGKPQIVIITLFGLELNLCTTNIFNLYGIQNLPRISHDLFELHNNLVRTEISFPFQGGGPAGHRITNEGQSHTSIQISSFRVQPKYEQTIPHPRHPPGTRKRQLVGPSSRWSTNSSRPLAPTSQFWMVQPLFPIARLEGHGFWLPGEQRSQKPECFGSAAPSTSRVAVVAGKTSPFWGAVGDTASVSSAFPIRQCSDNWWLAPKVSAGKLRNRTE